MLQFHSVSCLTCCLAKPGTVHYLLQQKKNYRETPASLKLTVSFPASFLLNTKHTLLAFLIINTQGSIQQKETTCLFSFQPKIAPDDFTYCNDFSQRVRQEELISGSTCCTLIEIKTCRLSAPLHDCSSLQINSSHINLVKTWLSQSQTKVAFFITIKHAEI